MSIDNEIFDNFYSKIQLALIQAGLHWQLFLSDSNSNSFSLLAKERNQNDKETDSTLSAGLS